MTNESEFSPAPVDPPDVSNWLLSFLDVRRREYEDQYTPAETDEERLLDDAIATMARRTLDLVSTGVLPADLSTAVGALLPDDSVARNVRALLSMRIVRHRLEFDIAEEVCARLKRLESRVEAVTLLTIYLLGYRPSDTSVRYFERATRLYLAGYDSEVVVVAGAVLDAALTHRFPDELLACSGMKPVFAQSGVFSLAQRLSYERRNPVLTEDQRLHARKLNAWRNEAIHVQPDIGPPPLEALVSLAAVLVALAPRISD